MTTGFVSHYIRTLTTVRTTAKRLPDSLARRTAPITPSSKPLRPRMHSSTTPPPPPPSHDGNERVLSDSVMDKMRTKISDALQPTRLQIQPTFDDPNGAHVTIEVVSDRFEGMNVVKRHQAVYKAIWEELEGPVHAVDKLIAKTPSEDTS